MFAIIDIETTGGQPEKGDKITEIAIIVHDGLSVIDRYSSLVNPERGIPPFVERLTGISNQMVSTAPKFYEIARKVVEMTENCVFVAHNVSFDYGFIKAEFKSLGFKYERDKLCTVKLSRKLLPGYKSYSLGKLCKDLGIVVEGRHRASGDAEATAKLFDILLQAKNNHPQFKRANLDDLNTTRLDVFKEKIFKNLPEETGVYFLKNKAGEIIYVGKSKNIKERIFSHCNSKSQKSVRMMHHVFEVDYVLTGSELIALLLESEEIKKRKPIYNRASIKDVFTHCIDWKRLENGVIGFEIVPFEFSKQPIKAFVGYVYAKEFLYSLIDKYELCLAYCGIDDGTGACFNYQIKKCKGICCGAEEIAEYNVRASELISEHSFPANNFIISGYGRSNDEKSFVMVENGRYVGYGYVPSDVTIHSAAEFKEYIVNRTYYPDSFILIKQEAKSRKLILF